MFDKEKEAEQSDNETEDKNIRNRSNSDPANKLLVDPRGFEILKKTISKNSPEIEIISVPANLNHNIIPPYRGRFDSYTS